MGFGNGAFQAARIAIDGVTIIENILTGKIEAPGVTIPSTPSTTTSSYLVIPITNTQNVATPAPFQQLVQLNLANYPQLSGVASDLSNIYFSSDEAGQNKLYSWRETPASLTSTQTWWVLLPNGIPANGTITVYLQVSSSTTLDGIYTGEAPQLSSTYGQYDNGANVFTNYWNFAGTSVPSGWTTLGTITINNGLSISGSSTPSQIETTSTFGTSVLDWYGYATIPSISGFWINMGWYSSTSTPQGNGWFTHGGQGDYGYGYVTSSDTITVIYIAASAGQNYVFSIANDGTNANYLINYYSQSTTYAMQTSTNYIGFRNGAYSSGGYGANVFVQWVRTRAYPPSGIMPALQAPTVKATQSIITTTENTWTASQTYIAPQNINVSQTALTGTTAGSIVYSMPYQGTIYKKFIAYASGYENDTTTAQTISFPVAFTNTPYVATAPLGLISSTTTTGITLASGTTTTYTGWIIIEGY